jgi:hypothetical protein
MGVVMGSLGIERHYIRVLVWLHDDARSRVPLQVNGTPYSQTC